MPRAIRSNLTRRTGQNRSLPVSAERLINLYAEQTQATAKAPVVLHGTPGLKEFLDLGTNAPILGMHFFNNLLYVVSGNAVYTVNAGGIVTKIGDTGTIVKPVQILDNSVEVVILDNANGATATATDVSISSIDDPDFRNPSSMTFLDGYVIYTERETDVWFISDLRDARSYNALDFTRAEADSDKAVRAFATYKELWIFGERSIELYSNTGNPAFPFETQQGASLQQGCGAVLSVAQIKNAITWLGEDGTVQSAVGYSPRKISTPAIDEKIRKIADISDAYGFTYTQEGHDFYVLTFPGDFTICYDFTVGEWHERKSFESPVWDVTSHEFAFGKNLVGSSKNGKIYELDLDTYTEDGEEIERIVQTPPFWGEKNTIYLDRMEIDFEPGIGLTLGLGSDPICMLQRSSDGGKTFSNELFTGIGKIGEYKNTAVYRRLGSAKNMTYRIKITDPVKISIAGIYAVVRLGDV